MTGKQSHAYRALTLRTGLGQAACLGAALLLAGSLASSAQQEQQVSQAGNQPTSTAQPDPGPRRPWTNPSQLAVPGQAAGNVSALNAARRKQIAEESEKLLKLAIDLKAEVDKTTKETLSITVIRKADEIEKLAHAVKDQMRLATGPN